MKRAQSTLRRLERFSEEEDFRKNHRSRFQTTDDEIGSLHETDSSSETQKVLNESYQYSEIPNDEVPQNEIPMDNFSSQEFDESDSSSDQKGRSINEWEQSSTSQDEIEKPQEEVRKKPLRKNPLLEENLKKEKRSKKFIVAALIALLILIFVGVGFGFLYHDKKSNTVTVPEAIAKIREAKQIESTCDSFKKLEIGCKSKLEYSDDVEKGGLIYQSIKPGEKIDRRDSEIILSYSNGPETLIMPNVSRMTLEEAKVELEKIGVSVNKVNYVDNPDYEKGRVIDSSIEHGKEIPNGAKVDLNVASGSIKMPDWKGKTREEVDAESQALGLNVTYTEKESEDTPGTVLSQVPAAGEKTEGADVEVVISKSKEGKTVKIPDVAGMSEAEAQQELISAGFKKISIATVSNDSITEAQVTQVVPGIGTNANSEEQIVLIVSIPPKPEPSN